MSKYPILTNTVLSVKEFKDEFDYNLVVDWACDMLLYGYETEHLLLLAATTKPTTAFESELYLDNAVEELGLNFIYGEKALISYTWTYVSELSKGAAIKTNLSIIDRTYMANMDRTLISDFTSLSYAWDCYRDDDADFYIPRYWEGATKDNLEDTTISYAKEWLEKYEQMVLY